ncbi:AfsA-related hotdog domain-containing protein [Streptomyces sp. NPDC059578]|uniref:AfsA-related hotdog domain-containing protein n=1 Tax=Streptomyces sp. NPDC059578 TaxID=3346874 RepID=UPI00368B6D6C
MTTIQPPARTGLPSDGAPPPGTTLGFDRTVPRATAHRRQVGEVFVTDSAQVGPDDFHLAFEVLRAHSLWSDRGGSAYHDPLASAEAARQGIFVLLHRHVGIPVELPFSLQCIALRVEDPAAYLNDRRTALRGTIHFRVTERTGRGAEVTALSLHGTVRVAERRAMTLTTDLVFMSQEDYDVFRSFQRAQKPVASAVRTPAGPLPPAAVGRELPANVVIGAAHGEVGEERRLVLTADTTHPAFFDHDYDHVPGPLMVEGMRQAALHAVGGDPTAPGAARPHLAVGCEAAFLDFVEFEADVDYRTSVGPTTTDGRTPVDVVIRQFDRDVVTGRIELLPDPAAPPRTSTSNPPVPAYGD